VETNQTNFIIILKVGVDGFHWIFWIENLRFHCHWGIASWRVLKEHWM
jgi:hypothetical protein